jgi:hypothetical protein
MTDCRVLRIDLLQSFTSDDLVYAAVCSTGEEFKGATTGEALLNHLEAHGAVGYTEGDRQ